MDQQTLSDRQRAILRFINQFADDRGYPPTIREIGAAVSINSTSVVNYNLNKLVKEGFISRSKDVSRGIRVVTDGDAIRPSILNVPLVGQIVSGQSAPHPGDDLGYYYDEESGIPAPRGLLVNCGTSEVLVLSVNGFLMIE